MRRLDHPATDAMGELLLLQYDIRCSIDAIGLWYHKYAGKTNPPREEEVIGNALFRDAVVQFIGCFDKKGLRAHSLDEKKIYGPHDGTLDYFHWLFEMRNAYAAHKYGAYRQCSVGVFIDPKTGTHGVSFHPQFWATPAKEGGPDLINFMFLTLQHVDATIDELQKVLLAEAKNLTEEQFKALPIAKNFILPPGQEAMSRADIRRAVIGGRSPSKKNRRSKDLPSE